MKRVIIIMLAAVAVVLLACNPSGAQDRTITKLMPVNDSYYLYNGAAADTLTANQDTIDFVLVYRNQNWVNKIAVKVKWDLVDGADTCANISLYGKEFEDDGTYVAISAAADGNDVNADNTIDLITSDFTWSVAQYTTTEAQYVGTVAAYDIAADTSSAGNIDSLNVEATTITNASHVLTNAAQTVTPFDKTYRYYRLRFIYTGPSGAGSGIKVDDIEFKFYTQ